MKTKIEKTVVVNYINQVKFAADDLNLFFNYDKMTEVEKAFVILKNRIYNLVDYILENLDDCGCEPFQSCEKCGCLNSEIRNEFESEPF